MSVKFTSRIEEWSKDYINKLDKAVLEIAIDIDKNAKVLAPHETGALVNSAKIRREAVGHYSVSFGGGTVKYAKKRHYENKKTPGSLHYLERASDTVSRNLKRYFKGL